MTYIRNVTLAVALTLIAMNRPVYNDFKLKVITQEERKEIEAIETIRRQVVKNKSELEGEGSRKLAKAIYKTATKYKLPTRLFTAILMQESSYRVHAKSTYYKTVVVGDKIHKKKVHLDFGIGQIYYKTISKYGFDKELLLTDLYYSLDASAKVLSDMRKMYSKRSPNSWWTRYNSSIKYKRELYRKRVERYL